jgi:hypothetical protein
MLLAPYPPFFPSAAAAGPHPQFDTQACRGRHVHERIEPEEIDLPARI